MNSPSIKLIAKLQKGDETAFRRIYEHYWERLYKICFYYIGSREDTEDILVDIFMSVWNNREEVRIENLDAYLVKAAKNQSFKYILRKQRLRKRIRLFESSHQVQPLDQDSPEKLLELKELDLQIRQQVDLLPEKTRNIFVLNREKGLTYQEIARTLGVSVKTVEYHISKALTLLGDYTLPILLLLFFLEISGIL